MASYPTAVYTASTKNPGQQIASAHVNSLDAEVAAIESALVGGSGLAHDLKFVDATYDIGKSGATRPRDFFLSRNATIGGTLTVSGVTTLGAVNTYLNDTSNANMTTGLTINQGAADNEILALKSSDVAHGMTSLTETDTWFLMQKATPASGGAYLRAFELTAANALFLEGVAGAATATRSTAGLAPVLIDGALKSTTAKGSVGADKNIVAFRDSGDTRFILDSDGDSHQDVGTAWTNFDSHDDVAVLNSLALEVSREGDPWKARIRQSFGTALDGLLTRQQMQQLKLVTFNPDGHHFVNMSKLTMLHTGAIRQVWRELRQIRALLAT